MFTGINAAALDYVVRAVYRIEQKLDALIRLEGKQMANIDDILIEVHKQPTLIESVKTLVGGLKKSLDDALAGISVTPEVQAKLDEVFATLSANDQALADAVTANTPAAAPAPANP